MMTRMCAAAYNLGAMRHIMSPRPAGGASGPDAQPEAHLAPCCTDPKQSLSDETVFCRLYVQRDRSASCELYSVLVAEWAGYVHVHPSGARTVSAKLGCVRTRFSCSVIICLHDDKRYAIQLQVGNTIYILPGAYY